jgi:hypothetical protein
MPSPMLTLTGMHNALRPANAMLDILAPTARCVRIKNVGAYIGIYKGLHTVLMMQAIAQLVTIH